MMQEILNRFPGISCAYVDAVGNVTTEYHGVSDRESGTQVDEHTIFPACSMSKFVTALCLMKLQEQHRIHMDDPVNTYLKRWKLLTPDGKLSNATIRMVMRHTAGIKDGENGFYGLRRGDPEISLMDLLEGRTFYNDRPVRSDPSSETAFTYSDAGYCVLQLLVEDVTNQAFADSAHQILFEKLSLHSTFYASAKNIARFEQSGSMATGYDGSGSPLPGKILPVPDLAGAGLWTTPKEMLIIAQEFIAGFNDRSAVLEQESARQMATAVEGIPWAGLGVFIHDDNILMTQGWGENGQCMMKINCLTGQVSVVMTNRNPEIDQANSGVEWLVNKNMLPDLYTQDLHLDQRGTLNG